MQARAKISGDRQARGDPSGAVDRLAAEMQAMRAKAAPEPAVPPRRSPRLLRRLLLAFALAIAATGVVLLWLASHVDRSLPSPAIEHPANPAQGPLPPG